MASYDLLQNDRMEILKWVSERNMHVPLADLAFMLDLDSDTLLAGSTEKGTGLYDYCAD